MRCSCSRWPPSTAARGGATSLRLLVPDGAAGERLDRFLAGHPEIGSRAAAERAVRAAKIDGVARPKSYRLTPGEQIELEPPAPRRGALAPADLQLRIAYEDEHLLVVDKPAGVVVHPAPGHAGATLVQGLLGHTPLGGSDSDRPGIVHRLDRDTSGLLVVSRSDESYRRLRGLMQQRLIERRYSALVVGVPRSRRGTIEAPIGRDRRDRGRYSLDTDTPRHAVTHFELREALERHSLLELRLETGRTHQIRVHLESIGLPLAGDPVYGRAGELGLRRQFLHAERLTFDHPFTGRRLDLTSALPADLAQALERAR